ncbi:MAG: SDR family NAD(P)-dependent oxidoreductase [Polyangiaceae bacterium]
MTIMQNAALDTAPRGYSRNQVRLRHSYGPWAVVTGASDGIGLEFAQELARAGFSLVIAARREARLNAVADNLREAGAPQVKVVAVDLGAPQGVSKLVEVTQALDIGLLVASAGFGTSGDFIEANLPQELEMIDVNCRAVVELCHAFARRFKQRGGGGLLLLSSLVAFQGVPRAANYAATKAFIQTFAEGLRAELKPHGIDVLACAPGPVQSGFAERAHMTMGMAQRPVDIAWPSLMALGRRTTVRPGWLAKLLEYSLALLPRWGRVQIMARVMRGMTQGASS